MPTASMRWVIAQPEHLLSLPEALVEIDQVHYGLKDARYVADGWNTHVVKTDLNAVLENLCAAMNEELGVAFDKYFGTDTDSWEDLDVLESVRLVVAQAASRFTVGMPLCK
jgi:hypothetical protein